MNTYMFHPIDEEEESSGKRESSRMQPTVKNNNNMLPNITAEDSMDGIADIEAFELELLAARLPKKQAWTKIEDTTLLKLVKKYGAANWDILAKYIKNRTGKQCRERYHNILDPNVRKGNWTAEEDQKIIEMHGIIGNQWAKISRCLVGRTDNSVKNRFYAITKQHLYAASVPSASAPVLRSAYSSTSSMMNELTYAKSSTSPISTMKSLSRESSDEPIPAIPLKPTFFESIPPPL